MEETFKVMDGFIDRLNYWFDERHQNQQINYV